jgi:eukaryotic-like serine/threonine-protein kinase
MTTGKAGDTISELPLDPTTEDSFVGRLLAGRYELHEELAKGGMGAIYKALQRGLGRWVAVKLLLDSLGQDDEVARRFYREMQATARIEHPNTVRIYDFGHSEQGDLFLVMELLKGKTLEDVLIDEGPLSPARTTRIGAQIASALCAAHREGVIHRDLKPENILLCQGYGQRDVVKVLDFGLARLVDAHPGDRTQVGQRVGTPLYMAPETVQREVADERSDLYALGVLLYEMVVGRPPFTGSPGKVMHQHVNVEAPSAAAESPAHCPAWLDTLIASLLRKDPDARPQEAGRVAHVLEKGMVREAAVQAGHVRADAPFEPDGGSNGAWRTVALVGAAATGGAVLGGLVAVAAAVALWLLLGS